jgi:hypothetical protein
MRLMTKHLVTGAVGLGLGFLMVGCNTDTNNAEMLKAGPPGQAAPNTPHTYAERAKVEQQQQQQQPAADYKKSGYPGAR